MFRSILAAVVLFFLTDPGLATSPVKTPEDPVVGRASVIDGDTIEIHGKRIRLYGIDAPEGRQSCIRSGQSWRCGQAAANALDARIGIRPVACHRKDVDRYGRIVAVCREGTEDLNGWLVREGWAMAYRRYSTHYVDEEQDARKRKRGIWSSEFMPPWEWRRQKRGEISSPTQPWQASAFPPADSKRVCCKICRKGKACGDSCISRSYTCRSPQGCAC